MAMGFKFDPGKCVGCKACEMGCKIRFDLPLGDRRRRVYASETGVYPDTQLQFLSMACNHCESPACLAACPKSAISKDSVTGVVKHDKSKCVGCRRCEWACPYGAMTFNGVAKKVDKCEACYDRAGGPACVANCTGGALTWEEVVPNTPAGFDLPSPTLTNPNFQIVE